MFSSISSVSQVSNCSCDIKTTEETILLPVHICQFQEEVMLGSLPIKVFPLQICTNQVNTIDQDCGCDFLLESASVKFSEFDFGHDSEAFHDRLSKIITTGFSKLCNLTDRNGECSRGSCHDFAHFLVFGIDDGESTYDADDVLEKLPKNIAFEKFTQETINPKDVFQICMDDNLERNNHVLHSAVYLGNGKYICKIGLNNIYIQDFPSIMECLPEYSRKNCRIMKVT